MAGGLSVTVVPNVARAVFAEMQWQFDGIDYILEVIVFTYRERAKQVILVISCSFLCSSSLSPIT